MDVSTLQDLPLLRRTTIQDVDTYFGVSTSKVHKMKHEGTIKHVSNAMKPYLAEKRVDRLKWCLAMLDPRSIPGDPIFKVLFNYIFIDEKWFNITRKTERYYVAPGDEQPVRRCQNKKKNYIPKIMFSSSCIFYGKIGCPFRHISKRSTANRPANLYSFNKTMLGPMLQLMIKYFVMLLSKMASTSDLYVSHQIHLI